MSKNTNLSFLTDFLTADIVNSRVGMNNVSPQSTFDVTGTGKFSGVLTLGSTVSNGTYTYTLPSATGTLALTSDIPSVSGYVPYTGANQSVDLGYNSLAASFLRVNGTGPTLGSYLGFKHSTNVTTGADGYTSIYTFGTNTIAFKSISGATTRDFSFSMASITPGVAGGRTYTLPDADGTIALTSAIPANPVGGTGTAGQVAYWSSSSAITGISNFLFDASQRNLTIDRSLSTLGNAITISKGSDADQAWLAFKQGGGASGTWRLGYTGDPYDFRINVGSDSSIGTQALRIFLTTQNVLIGTGTGDNGAKFQVNGGATITNSIGGSTPSNYLQIEGATANNTNYPSILFKAGTLATTYPNISLTNGGLGLALNSGIATAYNNPAQINVNNGVINFFTGDNAAAIERMRIASDGTKYFGNPSGSRFQITASGENVYQYSNSYYIWGLYNDANNLAIESLFAGSIILKTAAQTTSSTPTTGVERMRITSGGSVGINNNSPMNSAWGNDTNTKQLSINASEYAVINLQGSTSRKYSMGVGDNNFYMCYDNTANRHNIIVNASGNVLIGGAADNGRRLNVNGTGLFSGTLSTAKVEVGAVNSVNITTGSTFTLIPSGNFNIRTNILVSVAIKWDNNANAQRQYLLLIGATDTGWGTPNSAISVIASNDWSSGYVGAASFSIGGSGQLRTLNISVSGAATYNVTAYAAIVDM